MKIKKGDNVILISGADKGKTGKVVASFPTDQKVVIEGLNMRKKHQRASRSDQKGQVIEKAMPIHVSNVAIVDPSNGKASRVGKKLVGEKFVRISKKSGSTL
ncbi:MAG: 50S ribosomal protein L24 [Candidatus Taylorbacteria bacterium RIFCSPHIGHO2_01_FULL_46_22b]|uniref:Large ribosomal subunit protein uL24 n=1 Tax=Candidatus Taylorbacteria bacterium RIFCSPHIGHO2_01_FULL_46_22b TaxID=1802301 RepID=A0A1G2M2S0_9BACT|nr:MAG: 50S ribosomal protein L24 [Candidatus Taylorbacteria bacterium RIFCSPHIGHO2_01_FULL_46_22b]